MRDWSPMRVSKRVASGTMMLSAIVILLGGNQVSAEDVLVGVRVPEAQQKTLARISHDAWDELLKSYVDEHGMVDYRGWKASNNDVRKLDDYLNQLSYSNGQGSREQQLVFWINTYNAVTIKGILREYPTSSIRNHTAKLWGYNIWKNLKLVVGGEPTSLEAIEHEILRKMGEPRIHFAINCASIGCPKLLDEAYVAQRLDEQLERNTKDFFSDNQKFRYDASSGTFALSPILKWFSEDFGDSRAAVLQRIAKWLPSRAAQQAAARGQGRITYLDYDWGLNDQK